MSLVFVTMKVAALKLWLDGCLVKAWSGRARTEMLCWVRLGGHATEVVGVNALMSVST